jgi:GT2 family glycosyltransferase
MTKADVVIAILNYNGRSHLEYSVPKAVAQTFTGTRVVVVDNASTDDSLAWLARHHPEVGVIRLTINRGYSAFNVLLDHDVTAEARYVLLMTNDVMLDARCVEHAHAAAEDNRSLGIIGFNMLGALKWVPPEELDKASAALVTPALEARHWIEGAAMFCRQSMLRALGGIDADYFAYCDEDDLQTRTRAAGYLVQSLSTPVWHNAGKNELARVPARSAFLQMRNTIRMRTKNDGLFFGLKAAVHVFEWACSPWKTADRAMPYEVRHRPFSPIRNFPIACAAIGWNVVHLPATLEARNASREAIGRAKRERERGQ